MPELLLSNIRIVLVSPTHPGNVGSAARAMKTMGLSRLYLVTPRRFPHPEAVALASGADDVLDAAVICSSLSEALADCALAVASTTRKRSYPFPMLEPRPAARALIEAAETVQVALVFGPEHSGLSNEDLDRCQMAVSIPANPEFSSLNVAAAVQVLCYELAMARNDLQPVGQEQTEKSAGKFEDPPASSEDMERFYAHMEDVLIELKFLDPANPKHLMRRLRLIFNRATLTRVEVNILRGILRAVHLSHGVHRDIASHD